jgi:hypothetical protein
VGQWSLESCGTVEVWRAMGQWRFGELWESGGLEQIISELLTGLVLLASPSGSLWLQYRMSVKLTGPQERAGRYREVFVKLWVMQHH